MESLLAVVHRDDLGSTEYLLEKFAANAPLDFLDDAGRTGSKMNANKLNLLVLLLIVRGCL